VKVEKQPFSEHHEFISILHGYPGRFCWLKQCQSFKVEVLVHGKKVAFCEDDLKGSDLVVSCGQIVGHDEVHLDRLIIPAQALFEILGEVF
jgi:hypothetical protein